MNFSCHGQITNWTALTLFDRQFASFLTHHIVFQVWRPSVEIDGKYTLVGSNTLSVMDPQGTAVENSTIFSYFSISEHGVEEDNQIIFQPGDCLGWFIPAQEKLTPPLNPVFLNSTNNLGGMASVDLFTTNDLEKPCEIYTCSDSVALHQSTVPYVRPTYSELHVNICRYCKYWSLSTPRFNHPFTIQHPHQI